MRLKQAVMQEPPKKNRTSPKSPASKQSRSSALAQTLLKRRLAGSSADEIPVRPAGALVPLSFAQERLWFLDRLAPESSAYNIARAFVFEGPLDVAALARSAGAVVARHESLRATFSAEEGLSQTIAAPDQAPPLPPLPIVDLSGLSAREAEVARLEREEARRPFDLERGPLLRLTLLRLGAREHELLLSVHHIAADGWSMGIFFRELGELYRAFALGEEPELAPLAIQYGDFARWQRDRLQGERLRELVDFWREQLAGAPTRLELPADHPRPVVQAFEGAGCSRAMAPAVAARLRAFCAGEKVTPFLALLAAFEGLLSRHTGQEDLLVGTPVAGRTRAELEGMIGLFVNNLVVRADLSGEPSFRQMVSRTKQTVLAGYSRQEAPFEKLVEELAPERSLAYAPLFQVMFGVQEAGWGTLELPGLTVAPREIRREETKLDLTFDVLQKDGSLTLALQFDRTLFDRTTMLRLAARFEELLAGALAEPDRALPELPLLAPSERHQVAAEWNDSRVETAGPACLHERFAAQAARTPEAVAVVFGDTSLTYRELDRLSNRVANRLREIGPDARVAVTLERSLEMVVALLGVLKAGGAYVPVDTSYPAERVEYMLADSRPAAVLTPEWMRAALAEENDAAPVSVSTRESLAYVLYTSGSTGRPKAVMVPHGAIVHQMSWFTGTFPLDVGDAVLQKTPFSFDASVWEFWAPLLTGARLVMAEPGLHGDTAYLAAACRDYGITALQLVPSLLGVLLEEPALAECRNLRRLFCGGEALSLELAAAAQAALPQAEVINLYGPTEATIQILAWVAERPLRRRSVPLGRPVWNTAVHILDRGLRPCPVGVPGELCAGGVQVSRGYLGRPELTAERFIPDPSGEPGARLYRTGDLARLLADGEVEYLGRIDQQVKLRGFRVELGEIEAVLEAQPEVRQAVVVVSRDAGEPRLVAYVTVADLRSDLRDRLRSFLPESLVPAAILVLESLPRTPSGKVDRAALAQRGVDWAGVAAERPFVAPRTALEEELAGLWRAALKLDRLGVHDSFFELGGSSISGALLINRLQRRLGEPVHVAAIFEAPTVAGMAARLAASYPKTVARLWGPESLADGEAAPALRAIEPAPWDGVSPLPPSFAQERLWFIDQLDPGSAAYNIPALMRLSGPLDAGALERSIQEVVRRHRVLRTRFEVVGDNPAQVVVPEVRVPLLQLDLTGQEAELRRLAREEALRPFDLGQAPLLRTRLVRLGAPLGQEEHALFLTMHHIVSDGWSLDLFLAELAELYPAFRDGLPSPLPELPIQYSDYAVWQREWLSGETLEREIAWWRERLQGAPALLELPADRPRPAVQRFRGGRVRTALPAALTASLKELRPREWGHAVHGGARGLRRPPLPLHRAGGPGDRLADRRPHARRSSSR